MPIRKKSEGEASRLLAEYEKLNSDLPKDVRRQLAVFALATQVGKESLDALFGRPLGTTPFKHRAWYWYNCIRTSGLEPYWDELADTKNAGKPFDQCLYTLRDHATPDQWKLLSDRLGCAIFKGRPTISPKWWWRDVSGPPTILWTRGGNYDRRSNYTKIILLREPVERETYNYSQKSIKLGVEGCRRIEREINDIVDPDELLYPDALNRAIAYARERITQVLELTRPTGYKFLSWFFHEPVRVPGSEGFALWTQDNWRTINLDIGWEWLPDEPDEGEDRNEAAFDTRIARPWPDGLS